VIIWNDDYHTPEYVIELLMTLFAHPLEAAEQISSAVDKTGKGVAYTCHQELAELKRDQILNYRPEFLGVDNLGPMWATIEPSPD
jgi:ATP-dependent Clp protease adaptor protein ClpS